MKSLRTQFEEINEEWGLSKIMKIDAQENLINKLLQAVKERDEKSVGSHVTHSCSCRKDEEDTYCSCGADEINEVKDEIARSLQQTLGDAEDWTRNSI